MAAAFGPKAVPITQNSLLTSLIPANRLLKITYDRFLHLVPKENIYVVTADSYDKLVKEQLPDLQDHQILKEPVRRNTAPCIAYACDKIHAHDPNATVIISPSDHLIIQEDKFYDVMNKCTGFVEEHPHLLVTIGVKPTKPSTGYGYIQFLDESSPHGFYKVKTFTEKPTPDLARTFLQSGDFLWNSGMFVWKAGTILEAIRKYLPEIGDAFREGHEYYNKPGEENFIREAYSQCANISIDYGVMEKADNVYTTPAQVWLDRHWQLGCPLRYLRSTITSAMS